MKQFAHDSIVPNTESKQGKKQQVAEMFNKIAFRYDFLNRFLSAGIDVYWRKIAIKQLKQLQPKQVLDVATGTADVALLTQKMLKPQKIVGIDISEGMLDLGRKKITKAGLDAIIELQKGDSENIKFDNNSFDAITVAFGVRNFENLLQGLKEMNRVLKSGGKIVILEFSKPPKGLFRFFYQWYLKIIAPGFVQVFASDKGAYQYLNDSVMAFPEGNEFLQILENAGFTGSYQKRLTFGICSIYSGIKP
ncbi:MAG: bifunctional demethylmenaquinone methyltransferase/2-methoxy-6-polyprenyl-1,4-benzoquinol methylase UbiE [Chitinophagaceae bacterium]